MRPTKREARERERKREAARAANAERQRRFRQRYAERMAAVEDVEDDETAPAQ